jgi:hypothetical protein
MGKISNFIAGIGSFLVYPHIGVLQFQKYLSLSPKVVQKGDAVATLKLGSANLSETLGRAKIPYIDKRFPHS